MFSVKVSEGHAPIVDTLLPYATEDGQLGWGRVWIPACRLRISLVFLSAGVRLWMPMQREVEGKTPTADDGENFGFEFSQTNRWISLVVAYARNEKYDWVAGNGGPTLRGVEDSPHASLYSFAEPIDGAPGWWNSLWFGNFYHSEQSGWLLHLDLGWLYPSATVGDGLWFWKESIGWFWTKSDLYPFLYSSNSNGWMYFYGDLDQRRLLFDYARKKWIRLDETQIDEEEGAR